MKPYILTVLILCGYIVNAQDNYSYQTTNALQLMWKAKNEIDYKKALDLYEAAFDTYPDSIDTYGLYNASVLASQLKDYDKAFKYLTPLSAMKIDQDGYPIWSYIIGQYSQQDYKNLVNDPRWKVLKHKAIEDKASFFAELQDFENEFYQQDTNDFSRIKEDQELYNFLRQYNPYQSKNNQDYSLFFNINDSTKTSFLVHLPKDYNPKNKYSVLFFLHGAVRNNTLSQYQVVQENLEGWNRFYAKYAQENNVILVFPKGGKQYNWMTPDDGFYMIPEMVKLLKKAININDNKVFISGHSNGATGSFSYLIKQPTPFAGFYGFNTYPKVFTGGTFIENSKNRSFINFSTDLDYYYPPNANDDLVKLMQHIQADYKDYRYEGFPHWFPEFDESQGAYQILFNDLSQRRRDPFPKKITWEFDDKNYASIDWISNIKLDTTLGRKHWHKDLNFKINKWLKYQDSQDELNDNLIEHQVDIDAFNFPRESGKITANYNKNIFDIQTSNVSCLTILISPEMIDLNKKVKIYLNGKLYFNKKVSYNRDFMLKNFQDHRDREQVWINYIKLNL